MASKIKPIPLKEYDGTADTQAYHCFMWESDAYLRDGKVQGHHKVFLLSYYLTSKAYDLYTQKVSMNEEDWTVWGLYTPPRILHGLIRLCTDSEQSEQIFSSHFTCVNVLGVWVNLLGLWAVRTDSLSSNPLARTRTEISLSSDRPYFIIVIKNATCKDWTPGSTNTLCN